MTRKPLFKCPYCQAPSIRYGHFVSPRDGQPVQRYKCAAKADPHHWSFGYEEEEATPLEPVGRGDKREAAKAFLRDKSRFCSVIALLIVGRLTHQVRPLAAPMTARALQDDFVRLCRNSQNRTYLIALLEEKLPGIECLALDFLLTATEGATALRQRAQNPNLIKNLRERVETIVGKDFFERLRREFTHRTYVSWEDVFIKDSL